MPRPLRVFIAGLSHHVFQRGHNGCAVFTCDDDYRRFLWHARRATAKNEVDVHGFTLMTTHYHLVVTGQKEASLSSAMQDLLSDYTSYFNRTYSRRGTLWNDRFRAKPIDDERYLLNCLRYVEANPMEAGMVTRPEEYLWTSYRVHATGEPSTWLRLHHVYLSLGRTAAERQAAYRSLWQSQPVPDWCGV